MSTAWISTDEIDRQRDVLDFHKGFIVAFSDFPPIMLASLCHSESYYSKLICNTLYNWTGKQTAFNTALTGRHKMHNYCWNESRLRCRSCVSSYENTHIMQSKQMWCVRKCTGKWLSVTSMIECIRCHSTIWLYSFIILWSLLHLQLKLWINKRVENLATSASIKIMFIFGKLIHLRLFFVHL